MTTLPLASFLAGSLISLLMPTILLVSIVVWYMRAVRRPPGDGGPSVGAPAEGHQPTVTVTGPTSTAITGPSAAGDPGTPSA